MRKYIYVISLLFISLLVKSQESFTLQKIVQIKENRYELSGFALHPDYGVVCIQDEKSEISVLDTMTWKLSTIFETNIENSDFEGIDVCNSIIYFLNERNSKVYKITENKVQEIGVKYKDWEVENNVDLQMAKWRNAGYEGFAIDCSLNRLYLAKERKAKNIDDGRFVFEVDINNGKILRKIDIKAIAKNPDFADAKFENKDGVSYLYLLERNSYSVVRVDLSTLETERYSFREIGADKNLRQNLYKSDHAEFGIAEALLLTENQIWIGVDNNQMSVIKKNKWVKKYHLKGNAPAILIFQRPDNF